MGFKDKFRQSVEGGLKVSKKILHKAKEKAKDLGDLSMIKLEIKQLEDARAEQQRLLGETVYALLEEQDKKTVSRSSGGVKEHIQKLSEIAAELKEVQARFDESE